MCDVDSGKPEAYTKPFCDFLTENPTIFHAVEYFKTKLEKLGFVELPARDDWKAKIKAGGKYWSRGMGARSSPLPSGPSTCRAMAWP